MFKRWFKKKSASKIDSADKKNNIETQDNPVVQISVEDINDVKSCVDALEQATRKNFLPLLHRLKTIDSPSFIKNIQSHSRIADIVLSRHDVDEQIKQQLVDTQDDVDVLKLWASELNDKVSQRLVRAKIKSIHELQEKQQHVKQQAEALLNKIEHLSTQDWEPLFAAKLQHIDQQWKELNNSIDESIVAINDMLVERYDKAKQQCQKRVDENEKLQCLIDKQKQYISELEDHIDSLKQSTPHDAKNSETFWQALSKQWDDLLDKTTIDERLAKQWNGLKEKLEYYHQADKKVFQIQAVSAELRALFESGSDEVNKLYQDVKQQLVDIAWPSWLTASSEYQRLDSLLMDIQQSISKASKNSRQALDHIKQKNRELGIKVQQKNLHAASRLYFYIQKKLKNLDEQSREKALAILEKNTQSLKELDELNRFATEPKKQQLIESMKALVNADKKPDVLAEKIRSLQTQWGELSVFDKSDDPLWQEFHAFANQAWEPCEKYFEQQRETRKENLNQRKQVCEQLQYFNQNMDWDNADWEKVIATRKQARDDWNKHRDVDFKASRKTNKQFAALMDQLSDKIAHQQQVHLQEKSLLIEKVAQLDSIELEIAIEKVKFFQQQWRAIPVLQMGGDRKLRKQFKKVCQQVFDRRDEMRQAKRAEVDEQLVQADEIINQVQALASVDASELTQNQSKSKSRVDELKRAFNELPVLPEKLQDKKQYELDRACAQFDAVMEKLNSQKFFDQLESLNQLSDALTQAENDSSEANIAKAQQLLDQLQESVFKHKLSQVKQRFEQCRDANDANQSLPPDSENALSLLVIDYEVLADVETPQAFKQQRMNYQLHKLEQGPQGSSTQSLADQLLELDCRWAALPHGLIESSAQFFQRQLVARQQLLKKLH